MYQNVSDDVCEFFAAFQRDSDGEGAVQHFAEAFMSADPAGVRAVTRSQLAAALPNRKALFQSIGVERTRLTSLAQTELDDHYILVTTSWEADLADPERFGGHLELSSTFILRRDDGTLRIVFYLNHQDIVTRIQELAQRSAE